MREIVERLHENRQIELAKSILESNGYKVSKRVNEGKYSEEYWDIHEGPEGQALEDLTYELGLDDKIFTGDEIESDEIACKRVLDAFRKGMRSTNNVEDMNNLVRNLYEDIRDNLKEIGIVVKLIDLRDKGFKRLSMEFSSDLDKKEFLQKITSVFSSAGYILKPKSSHNSYAIAEVLSSENLKIGVIESHYDYYSFEQM